MELEWMGEYRLLVEEYIRGANLYARKCRTPSFPFEDIALSATQIQVLEYILENETVGQPMSALEERLGITRSAFTKITAKLEEWKLVERGRPDGNSKVFILRLTERVRRLYEEYSARIFEKLFAHIFSTVKGLDPEQLQVLVNFLRAARGAETERTLSPSEEFPEAIQ